MVYQLVYCSRNRLTGDTQQIASSVESILHLSRQNNAAAGVTGALLFNGEAFAQVLEGPRDAVDMVYAKVRFDPRHSHVVLLSKGESAQRSFANWSMAYMGAGSPLVEALPFDAMVTNPAGLADQILSTLRAVVNAHAV